MSGAMWHNWAGTVRCHPSRIVRVRDEAHIADVLRSAEARGASVRCVGSGHSFNRLATTDDTLLDTTSFQGVEAVDQSGGT